MRNTFKLFIFTLAVLIGAEVTVKAQLMGYPVREGPRPQTTNGVPHVQIGAVVRPEISGELLRRVSNIPHVYVRETVISLPGAKGFWINEELPLERPDVIIRGREFAHMHPDGSLHASLKPEDAAAAIKAGWAIQHPWSGQRPGWEGFVMIYSPTNKAELDMVFRLVADSFKFISGIKMPAEE